MYLFAYISYLLICSLSSTYLFCSLIVNLVNAVQFISLWWMVCWFFTTMRMDMMSFYSHGDECVEFFRPWWCVCWIFTTMVMGVLKFFDHGDECVEFLQPWRWACWIFTTMVMNVLNFYDQGDVCVEFLPPWWWVLNFDNHGDGESRIKSTMVMIKVDFFQH